MSEANIREAMRAALEEGEILNTLADFMDLLNNRDLSLLQHMVGGAVIQRVEKIHREISEGPPRWLTPKTIRHLVSDSTPLHDEGRMVLIIHAMCAPNKGWRLPLGDLAPMLEDGDGRRNAMLCQRCVNLMRGLSKAEGPPDQG